MFPLIQPFGSEVSCISWQSVLTTCHWRCKLTELFNVLCHEALSDFNCFQASYIQCKSWSIDLVVEAFPRVLFVLLQWIFLCRNLNRRCGCHYQYVCWREKWVRLSCQNKSPRSCLADSVFITQVWDCSVDTELINRNDCAKKTVSIVSPSAQKCIDHFPPPLLLSVPRDNGLVARKTGCPLSLNLININLATLSHSPCGQSI